MEEISIRSERVSAAEYTGFLKRTDLGSQYPKERFEQRIGRLVESVSVSLTASGIQILDLDQFTLDNFPYGLHRLNMRVAAYGNQYSPVYSAMVMRWPNGPFNYIAYWLDDDHDTKNLKKIKASAATDVEGYFEMVRMMSSPFSSISTLNFFP